MFSEETRLLDHVADGFNDDSTGVVDEESLSEDILSSLQSLSFFNLLLLNSI